MYTAITTILFTVFVFFAGQASADRLSFSLGSHHSCPEEYYCEFNEVNPGIFYTIENEVFDYSFGVYDNSFSDTSVIGLIHYNPLTYSNDDLSASLGVFGGAAYYPDAAKNFDNDFLEHNVLPVVGVQGRLGQLVIQVMPGDLQSVNYVVTALWSIKL